jgi:hypothetical protein
MAAQEQALARQKPPVGLEKAGGDGGEINQLVMHGGTVLEGQHEYQIGDDKFIAKPLVCYLEKEDFITIESGYGDNKKVSHVLKVDGKKKIMQLAGVDTNKGHFTVQLGPGNRDVCEYESVGEWMSPTGRIIQEKRLRRIDLKEIERQQTMQKMKYIVAAWENGKKGYNGQPGIPAQPEKVKELKAALLEKLSAGMTTEDALYSLRGTVLPLSDILQIQSNVADMREHLPAITQSKCQSQLGTAMMRNFGGRVTLAAIPGDRIKVYLINTVKVGALSLPENEKPVELLYGDETVTTAEGEEKPVEEVEDGEAVRDIQEAEQEEAPKDDAIDAEYIETPSGEMVDTGTGEIVEPEGEAPYEEEAPEEYTPTPEYLMGCIQAAMTEMEFSKAKRIKFVHEIIGNDGSLSGLSMEQLQAVLSALQEGEAAA